MAKTKNSAAKSSSTSPAASVDADATEIVAKFRRMGSDKVRFGMARYAIPSDNAFGISVGSLRALGKKIGKNHELAEALWQTGWYEARMLAIFIDDAAQVSSPQMDQWCRDFDSWAICDTACFHLFDRTPHSWKKTASWSGNKSEFVKRAAFALLASLTVHDKQADDGKFLDGLKRIEKAANDERNFVKKAVNWALRSIGKRNLNLHAAAVSLAKQLADTDNPASRWIGKDALRELTSGKTVSRLKSKK